VPAPTRIKFLQGQVFLVWVPKTYATRRYSSDHAPGAVTPLNPEMVQIGDTAGQRAQWRSLLEGSVRPVGIAEVLVFAQDDHQVPLIPDQGPVQQLSPAAADPPLSR
jgi:hypothetical protein